MRFRTTSMPRSLDALSSITASRKASPSRILARHKIVVVFPTPGGPAMMMFGTLPSQANTDRRETVSGGRGVVKLTIQAPLLRPLLTFIADNLLEGFWPILLDPGHVFGPLDCRGGRRGTAGHAGEPRQGILETVKTKVTKQNLHRIPASKQ